MTPMTPLRERVAYGSIGWVTWPLADVARKVAAMGIRGIEGLGLTELMPEDQNLGAVLKSLNVKFAGSYFGASLVQKDRRATEIGNFTATVRKVSEWGGSVIALGGGRDYPEASTTEREVHWQNLIEGVHEFARIAQAHQVQIGFHPHDHTRVYRLDEIRRFLKDTAKAPSPAGLTFDTAHIGAAGMDILDAWEEFAPRVVHVHVKDLTKIGDFCELGAGQLPLQQFVRMLREKAYPGWLTIELDATPDPEASALKSWNQLKLWI